LSRTSNLTLYEQAHPPHHPGVGHHLPREASEAFAAAVAELAGI
jgi:hypothetical protein